MSAKESQLKTQLRFAQSMGKVPHDHTKGPPKNVKKHATAPSSSSGTKKMKKQKRENARGKSRDDDDSDVVLSEEMSEWLTTTFEETDEDGFLKESLGSHLVRPLDAMAIFTPTASIMTSKTAAPKIPPNPKNLSITQINKLAASQSSNVLMTGTKSIDVDRASSLSSVFDEEVKTQSIIESTDNLGSSSVKESSAQLEPPHPLMQTSEYYLEQTLKEHEPKQATFSEAVDTLEVMWLKRKAMFEEEDGDYDQALKTLETAIEIHLGPEGSQDYSKARLAEPVVASDPMELIQEFEDTFVPYDIKPHAAAERIQRIFRKHERKRNAAQLLLSKIYRGYHYRQIYKKHLYVRHQCAYLIQRRFRSHLGRVIRLANKLKGWYKTRVRMRDYMWRLYFYRMARRIQKRQRGIVGRRLGFRQRFKTTGVIMIQRNFRAYLKRRQRFIALAQCHRHLYYAARRIQKRIRIFNAIRRAQDKLVGVSIEEEERMGEETEVYQETIRIETEKLALYLKTEAGKLHLEDSRATLRAKDNAYNRIKHTLTKDEIDAHEAKIAFEIFDTDGSGQIDVDELSNMLTELCIPMEMEEVIELAEEMDGDGSGDIDFDEFLEWYSGKGQKITSVGALLFKQVLKARSAIMEATGVTLAKRTELDVLRQVTTWSARDTACMYRMKNPPKYSCCRCMTPFVLFSEYFGHFENGEICPQTNEKAVYFRNFADQQDWTYQRMIEAEIMRERDEDPCLQHASTMAIYEDLALQQDSSFKLGVQSYLIAAKDMFFDKLNEDTGAGLGTYLVDIVNMTGEGILYPYIAKRVCKLLGQTIPEEWVAQDEYSLEKFQEWATELYPDGEVAPVSLQVKIMNMMKMMKQAEADAKTLGYVYFVCLRLLTASTEAQLGALIALRKKRPRVINMSEEQLDSLDLSHLSLKGYNRKRDILVRRMKNLNGRMQELVVLSLKPKPPCCSFLAKKTEEYASVSPSDLSDAAFRDLRVLDAHNSAAARLRSFQRTRAGKMYVRRLASELWARKRMIQKERSLIDDEISSDLNSIQYLWEKLASSITNEGIDPYDIDIFQGLLPLKIRKDDISNVVQVLTDPVTGYIELNNLIEWLTSGKADAYMSITRRITNGADFVLKWLFMMMYLTDARTKCLALFRKMARIDIELHHRTIKRYIKSAEEDEAFAAQTDVAANVNDLEEKKKKKGKKDSNKEADHEKDKKAKKKDKNKKAAANTERQRDEGAENKKKKKGKNRDNKDGEKKDLTKDSDAPAQDEKEEIKGDVGDGTNEKQRQSSAGNVGSEEQAGTNGADVLLTSPRDNVDELDSEALKIAAGIEDTAADASFEDSPTEELPTDIIHEPPQQDEETLDPEVAAAIAEENALKEEAKMQESLDLLRSEFKLAEEKLIFRMTENDAEYSARKRFFSRLGRYQIKHEKMLMKASSVLFQAFGYCVSPSSNLPALPEPSKAVKEATSSSSPTLSPLIYDNASYESVSQEVPEADSLQQSYVESGEGNFDGNYGDSSKQKMNSEIVDIPDTQRNNYSPVKTLDVPVSTSDDMGEDIHLSDSSEVNRPQEIDIAWKLAISMWIYTFDTDCSGTFDESEVNLLLKFLFCGLSERQLLLQFPEVNKDSASLDTMVEYLVTKVFWVRGFPDYWTSARNAYVMTMSSHSASTMLLISLQRQAARELALQTLATQKGTRDDEDENRNDDAVIVRSQMFAMRQVEMFLKTIFGKLQIAVELERLKEVFIEEVKDHGFSKRSLLIYAYHVHRNYSGMMNTELSHIIRFIVVRLKMKTTVEITSVANLLSKLRTREDLKILSLNETLKILDPCFEDPCLDSRDLSSFISRNMKKRSLASGKRKDSVYAIYSKARQQAIQIALGLGGVHAADTNYRCLILGLHAMKSRTLKSKIWRGFYHFEIGRDKSINWLEVPREATMLLLLSRGYLMKDMTLPRTRGVTSAYHPSGNIGDDLIDVHDVVFCSRRDEAMTMNFLQSAYRWCRLPFGLPRYIEYKRTVAVLTKHRREITIIGAMFLKELVEGTSHCGEIETLQETVI